MNDIPLKKAKGYLLLLFGFWLIALQSITLSHAAEHALEADHSYCQYSNFYHDECAGPTSSHVPVVCLQQVESTTQPLYFQPAVAWLSNQRVRAPPF